ncbi:MAG: N-methyl-L-tryptophan oxidase [Betaproteobacteria bacterium]
MRTEHPEVLVIGLGAMGSATVYHLAKQGVKVIGIDQFTPPHVYGSSHGETRITRQAIGEGSQFVPLAMRSHQLWRELEAESGQSLLTACGGLIMARHGSASRMHEQRDFLGNTIRAAEAFGIAHEKLHAVAIASRFPQFMLQGDEVGYFEPGAGYLHPEECVDAQLTMAGRYGADLRVGETVQRIAKMPAQTIVETNRARYAAKTTVVCAGPWIPQLLPQMRGALTVRRQVLYWFEQTAESPRTLSYAPGDFPIFIWHWGEGEEDVFYGFPQIGGANAIKVATEQNTSSTTPQTVNRDVGENEISSMHARHLDGKLRNVKLRCANAKTCLYTNAPGANFIIDFLPDASDMIVVSACSGHGFKHSAAIGEAVATMATTGKSPDVLLPFTMKPNQGCVEPADH